MPGLAQEFLGLRSVEVEQVQTKDEELIAETHHLVLADGDETAVGSDREGMGESLVIAKDSFRLQHTGGLQLFYDSIGVVVGTALYAQLTGEQ